MKAASKDVRKQILDLDGQPGGGKLGHRWVQAYFEDPLKWFEEDKVRVLEWPSQRLDLNLMENEAVNEKN